MDLIGELSWRGMVQDIMPGTREHLSGALTTGYIGFDPTADSLHIGNLVPVMLLVHLQRAGHKPLALVGGATGMVGDPSGKSGERSLLDEEVLQRNLIGIKGQLEKMLDFDPTKPNAAEMVNNYDWFRDLGFLQFIRDTGKHISINYMMAKDSVKKRLDNENGMSFTEFSYQLVQGYDFYHLYTYRNCRLQMGGSDQWGNIVTGTELIRRKTGGEAFAFTCPLITRSDGGKFGKTEQGNVWLDPLKTTPYQFYQFWLNASDEDAEKWIRIFTLLDRTEIESLVQGHRENPSGRLLQRSLAREVTSFIHGPEQYHKAVRTTEQLFADPQEPGDLSPETLQSMEGVQTLEFPASKIESGIDLISLMVECGLFPTRGEARRMVRNGGISINRQKITDEFQMVTPAQLLPGNYLLIQKGKKHFSLIRAIQEMQGIVPE